MCAAYMYMRPRNMSDKTATGPTSADSAPPMDDEQIEEVNTVPPSTQAAPAQTTAASPAQPTQTQPERPAELGPNSLGDACLIISKHFGGSLTNIQYEFEHVVRDGSVITYFLPNSRTVIAQGRVWLSPRPIWHDESRSNAYLQIGVRDIVYDPVSVNAKMR